MKPFTVPSAYRDTMSPMWRKLDAESDILQLIYFNSERNPQVEPRERNFLPPPVLSSPCVEVQKQRRKSKFPPRMQRLESCEFRRTSLHSPRFSPAAFKDSPAAAAA